MRRVESVYITIPRITNECVRVCTDMRRSARVVIFYVSLLVLCVVPFLENGEACAVRNLKNTD